MSAAEALQSFSSPIIMAIGMAMAELTFRDADGASTFGKRYDRIRTWFEKDDKSGSQTSTRQAFKDAPRFDLGVTFEFSLEQLVLGLELVASKHTPR